MSNNVKAITELGQSIWLDNVSRQLLDSGDLARLIDEDGISGVTSNPTIFEKAIGGSDRYDAALHEAAAEGRDARGIFFELAFEDIRDGADLLRPIFDAHAGPGRPHLVRAPARPGRRRRRLDRGRVQVPRRDRAPERADQGAGHHGRRRGVRASSPRPASAST